MNEDLSAIRQRVQGVVRASGVQAHDDAWMRGFDRAFSTELGRNGLLGLTLAPTVIGGSTYRERHVITEELLRAGAPCAAHWLADRQIGPVIARYGSPELQAELLPGIRDGSLVCSVAISEPDAGSDVAAIQLRATPIEGGWRLDGRKLWTTLAHEADLIYVVARTSTGDDRHEGLTELVVPTTTPGLEIRPIEDMAGQSHFNELLFDGVEVPAWRLVGELGGAWSQVMAQLNLERAGPERVLSTYPTFQRLATWVREGGEDGDHRALGRLAARCAALRAMSWRVAQEMDAERPVDASASMVKDLGGRFEQEVVEVALQITGLAPTRTPGSEATLRSTLADGLRVAPAFTLRGGSSEVLAELIARRGLHLGRRVPSRSMLVRHDDEVAAVEEAATRAFGSAGSDPWALVQDLGLLELADPDRVGGVVAQRRMLVAVLRAQGRAARGTPVLGQLLAGTALRAAGWEPEAAGAIMYRAVLVPRAVPCDGGVRLDAVPWGRDARWAVVLGDEPRVLDLGSARIRTGVDLAGDPVDELVVPSAAATGMALDLPVSAALTILGVLEPLGRVSAVAGACRRALDDAIEHAHDREQFGRPLRSFQAVAHRLARAAGACELLDVAVDLAASSGSAESVACARIEAANVARDVAAHSHQVLGAIGITTEHALHRATLRARGWSLDGGARSVESYLGRRVATDIDAWWDATSTALTA